MVTKFWGGNIPKKTACIIKASSYDASFNRIDICQEDPFPNYRSTPDFSGSRCLNLLTSELSSQKNLDAENKYTDFFFSEKKIPNGLFPDLKFLISKFLTFILVTFALSGLLT